MESFDNSEAVYRHLRHVHGGIGIDPEEVDEHVAEWVAEGHAALAQMNAGW